MTSAVSKVVFWFVVLFVTFILFTALRLGAAELFSLNATKTMKWWKVAVITPSNEDVESVQNQLSIANFLAGHDPVQHENMARLSLIRAALPDLTVEDKNFYLQSGLSEIRSAISLRPVSPYSWTILLMIKRDLGQFDAEFISALHRAVDLGPWEPELLTALADVGLSAWKVMPEAEQALIQQVFVRGIERQYKLMQEVAEVHLNECADDKKTRAGCQ